MRERLRVGERERERSRCYNLRKPFSDRKGVLRAFIEISVIHRATILYDTITIVSLWKRSSYL